MPKMRDKICGLQFHGSVAHGNKPPRFVGARIARSIGGVSNEQRLHVAPGTFIL